MFKQKDIKDTKPAVENFGKKGAPTKSAGLSRKGSLDPKGAQKEPSGRGRQQ